MIKNLQQYLQDNYTDFVDLNSITNLFTKSHKNQILEEYRQDLSSYKYLLKKYVDTKTLDEKMKEIYNSILFQIKISKIKTNIKDIKVDCRNISNLVSIFLFNNRNQIFQTEDKYELLHQCYNISYYKYITLDSLKIIFEGVLSRENEKNTSLFSQIPNILKKKFTKYDQDFLLIFQYCYTFQDKFQNQQFVKLTSIQQEIIQNSLKYILELCDTLWKKKHYEFLEKPNLFQGIELENILHFYNILQKKNEDCIELWYQQIIDWVFYTSKKKVLNLYQNGNLAKENIKNKQTEEIETLLAKFQEILKAYYFTIEKQSSEQSLVSPTKSNNQKIKLKKSTSISIKESISDSINEITRLKNEKQQFDTLIVEKVEKYLNDPKKAIKKINLKIKNLEKIKIVRSDIDKEDDDFLNNELHEINTKKIKKLTAIKTELERNLKY
ncbi:hypothetical protein M0813_06867 [Anaeramoeba flamelloides]|uniref:Uncharacterized protein n=1 Tax=Anaeramoeba flamelloides TaxID=1746091 RepID=A0ABQ8XCF9_9EUKA|nr:hypothetical protein M0813_06867 [Anaeramoeba flamelloides]